MLGLFKKYARTIFDIALIVLIAFIIMYIFRLLFHIAAPIFIGYLIFLINEPFARFLHKHGLKKNLAATISMLMFIVAVLVIFLLLGVFLTVQIQNLIESVPQYFESIQEFFLDTVHWAQTKLNVLPPDVVDQAQEYISQFFSETTSQVSGFLGGAFNVLTSISTFLFHFFVGIILAFFLSIEVEMWRRLFSERSPETIKKAFLFLKENVVSAIGAYLKAQLILISATFVIVLAGLLILRIGSAFSVALLAAFFDIVPLLGVSVVFIPWIIYLFIVGEIALGVWLLLLLVIIIVFRQVMEPRIMGKSLGVSAFTVLALMMISLSLFGVAGLILSPLIIILVKALYENGYFKKWIHLPKNELEHQEDNPT